MQQPDAVGETGQIHFIQQGIRQRVAQRQRLQRIRDQLAQHRLRETRGGRIHRGEALLQRRVVIHRAAFRVHHLQPVIPDARLADRAYLPADGKLLLLAGIEIQKAQIQFAAAVLQAA